MKQLIPLLALALCACEPKTCLKDSSETGVIVSIAAPSNYRMNGISEVIWNRSVVKVLRDVDGVTCAAPLELGMVYAVGEKIRGPL